VTGKVQVLHGQTKASLELGPVQEGDPPVQQVNLVLRSTNGGGPVTAVVEEHDVRGEFTALSSYGGVTVRCFSQVLAEIRDIQRVH
jgi:hypothetical protein